MAVSKRLRFEILRRDNHACRYCGASAPDAKLTVDHVVPQALGGGDEPSNLVTACAACNSGKSATPADAAIVADVQTDALRWSRAMAQAVEIAHGDLRDRKARRADFRDRIWGEWTWEYPKGQRNIFDLPGDWEDTIDRFWNAGIRGIDFTEAVRIAMTSRSRNPFKYMCGILWRWISERQEITMEIISGEEAGS